jgi:protein-L-isoaspartate(D-aspartate) O-methyltransferase
MTHSPDDSNLSDHGEQFRPRTAERADDRERMVQIQIQNRGIGDPRVLSAMRNVPRHWFVLEPEQRTAYSDRPLPIGYGQTISQPYIVALMTELIGVRSDEKVLEIGTGSGYQAAILSELTTVVHSIEIVEPLAQRASAIFRERGYGNIHTRIGDGYRGWPEEAPFDAIIVTCAPETVPQALIDQIAPTGRLCIPVGPSAQTGQRLIVMRRDTDGSIRSESKAAVRFVPMTGEAGSLD